MTLLNKTMEKDFNSENKQDSRINQNLFKDITKKFLGNFTKGKEKEDNEVELNNELKIFLNNQIKDLQLKKKIKMNKVMIKKLVKIDERENKFANMTLLNFSGKIKYFNNKTSFNGTFLSEIDQKKLNKLKKIFKITNKTQKFKRFLLENITDVNINFTSNFDKIDTMTNSKNSTNDNTSPQISTTKHASKDFHIIFEFQNQTLGKNHFSEDALFNKKKNKTYSNLSDNKLLSNYTDNNTNINNTLISTNNLTNNEPRLGKELNISIMMKDKDKDDNSSYSIVIYKITFPEEEDLNTISYILGLQRDQNNFAKICKQCLDNSFYLKRLISEIYSIKQDMLSFSSSLAITRQELIVRFSEYINRVNMVKIQLFELNSNLDLLKSASCPNYDENQKNYDTIMKKTNMLIEIIQDSIRKQNLNINFIIIT